MYMTELGVICIVAIAILYAWKYRTVKKQMKALTEELKKTMEPGYNRMLTISLMDKELEKLAGQMNINLEYQKKMKWEAQQSETHLRQAISDIAHDLRTPITVVKGNLQMMDRGEALSGTDREYLHICMEKTDLLKKMVDEFFELSYFESEETEANLSRLDLTEFLAYFVVSHEAVIHEKGVEPSIELPEKSIFVEADKDFLVRMMENLFNNVIKHSAGSFCIELMEGEQGAEGKEGHGPEVVFSNPVPTDVQFEVDHLFDRTYRGNKARTGGGPGGLGLYIVKLLADRQGIGVSAKIRESNLEITLRFPEQA